MEVLNEIAELDARYAWLRRLARTQAHKVLEMLYCPQLFSQRIRQYANTVGRESVIAGTDCGFATFAGPNNPVAPSVVWAKLRTLSEGAALASTQLWKRGA